MVFIDSQNSLSRKGPQTPPSSNLLLQAGLPATPSGLLAALNTSRSGAPSALRQHRQCLAAL